MTHVEEYSFFDSVELTPEDPILGLPLLFAQDSRKDKVNLGIGSYKSASGSSYLLNVVHQAEELLWKEKKAKDYLPIEGDAAFNQGMIELILGKKAPQDHLVSLQTIGGTEALRLGGEFLAAHVTPLLLLSAPTWANHSLIFNSAGLKTEEYPFYNAMTHEVLFEEALKKVRLMPPGSAILLQSACHNPTGAAFTKEQWTILGETLKEKAILPFFDNAYQGFGKSLEEDVWPITLFLEIGLEMLIATSCSKNFGLYGERVGHLLVVSHHQSSLAKTMSQLKKIVRSIFSTPPLHGGRIVGKILADDSLKQAWRQELTTMRNRVVEMRNQFAEKLSEKSGKDFRFIKHQEGFFSLLPLTPDQVLRLRKEQGLYIPIDGRINIAGLTEANIDRTVAALNAI